jgi:class 3 adenylate cyclase
VIRAYQNAVAGEITRFEGHVAKFMGDGVLVYFSWPRTHEDAVPYPSTETERSYKRVLVAGARCSVNPLVRSEKNLTRLPDQLTEPRCQPDNCQRQPCQPSFLISQLADLRGALAP